MMPDGRAEDERGLRKAVLTGDERAWQTLYDGAFMDLAAYVAWRSAGLRDLADEVVQETWLIAVRRIRAFDPDAGTFLGWLRGIAANVVRSQIRQQRRRSHGELIDGELVSKCPDDQAEQIAIALANLPERYEAVLRAKYLDGGSVAQIASEWSETPKAIESLLSRAREAFRGAYLQREGADSILREAEHE
jgi:RNA polymerase sigma-70 factor (ECF subfamily)